MTYERILGLDIKQQYDEQGSAFFFKQWGGANKKKTGRELGDRTYDAMPAQAQIA